MSDEHCKHIVNGVLAYVVYAKATCTRDNLITVLDSTYTEKEIQEARDLLWSTGGTDLLGECPGRSDSAKRTKRHILCCDIYDAMRKIDATDIPFPSFVADPTSLGRLPKYNPEELNIVAMDQRMRAMEQLIHTLDATMSMKTTGYDALADEVSIMKVAVQQHTSRFNRMDQNRLVHVSQPPAERVTEQVIPPPVPSSVTLKPIIPGGSQPHATEPASLHTSNDPQSHTQVAQPPVLRKRESQKPMTPINRSVAVTQPAVTRDNDRSSVLSYSSHANDLARDPGFITVKRRRPPAVKGKSTTGNTFEGGSPVTRHVFLFNVNGDVPEIKVKEHMDIKRMQYTSIRRMSNENAPYKSFLITVPSAEYNKTLDPEMWPAMTKLREFRMPRGGLRQQNGGANFS